MSFGAASGAATGAVGPLSQAGGTLFPMATLFPADGLPVDGQEGHGGAQEPGPEGSAGVESVARDLARLLLGGGALVTDRSGELDFVPDLEPRPLDAGASPAPTWAVDGGQALVADARCLQVLATRAAVVCFRDGGCVVEEAGPVSLSLLGGDSEGRAALAGLGVADDAPVDVNLLRDAAEWRAVRDCVGRAEAGSLVLVDGDLVPDWRLPASLAEETFARARDREVDVVGVTKHSALARGGAPLVGQLELEAASLLGARRRWWVPVGRTRPGSHWPDLQVVVARLDPDARYAFRLDLPAGADVERVLGAVAAVSDDAAFPGYPYPLSVADRLAACPGWLRAELWLSLEEGLERAGVPAEVRERAFADRHRLMERA